MQAAPAAAHHAVIEAKRKPVGFAGYCVCISNRKERFANEPTQLEPREWQASAEQPLPTRRRREILPPGASRRGRLRTAASAIPAWLILGLIWWRAVVDQPDQLLLGAAIWAACSLFTVLWILLWVAWNRLLARRREARYGGRSGAPEGDIDYATDALGRPVEIPAGAHEQRHLTVEVEDGIKRIGAA